MKNLRQTILLVSAFVVAPLSMSYAMSSTGEQNANVSNANTQAVINAIQPFTSDETNIIRDVLETVDVLTGGDGDLDDDKDHKGKKNKNKQMPPGLAKRDSLPPGLEKQLERNGTLPPGLQGRELPDDLRYRLPKRKDGSEKLIVGDDVVLIERATRRIVDIIRDVGKK